MLYIIFVSQPSQTFIFRSSRFGFSSIFFSSKSFSSFAISNFTCFTSLTSLTTVFFFSKNFFGSFYSFFSKLLLGQTQFFYSRLLLKGIGFKGIYDPLKRFFHIELGFNNVCSIFVPFNVFIKTRKNRVILYSTSLNTLNRFISVIRSARYPDPYRGKGIRYHNQYIKFKIGKQR
jgi:hypothetical protein